MSLREHYANSLSKNTFGQSSINFLRGSTSSILLKKETEKYLEIPKLIEKLWAEIKESRYLDEGILSITNLNLIFSKHLELVNSS